MGDQLQTAFHTFAVVWYLILDVRLLLVGLTVVLSRWDILFGQFGIGIQYFTLWNVIAQQVYFIYSLLEDLMPNSEANKQSLHSTLSVIFYSTIFPLAFVVSLGFWVIYHLDPGLLDAFNALQDLVCDINHSVHTIIVVFVVIELLISDRPKAVSLINTFLILLFIFFIYGCVVYFCFVVGNVWPYPMLTVMSLAQTVGIIIFGSLIGVMFSAVGYSARNHVQHILKNS